MRRYTLVLAVASVALSTVAINESFAAQGAGPAPVATPPLLSAPSNAPVVTPSVIPPSSPSNASQGTPSTQPFGATTNPALTEQDNTVQNRGAIPAGSRLQSDDVLDRHRNEMMSRPATFPANSFPTTQGSGANTATGEQAIPAGTTLDRDDLRENDDMLLHNNSTSGAGQSSSGNAATGQQAVPAGTTLNRNDLRGNGDTLLNNRSATGANNTGGNAVQGRSDVQGPVPFPTSQRGQSELGRFVDPNRHDAFKPMSPRSTPNAPVTPNSTGGATGAQPGSMGK